MEGPNVVQTTPKVIQRCLVMTTDPGDLVFDPTLRIWHNRSRRERVCIKF